MPDDALHNAMAPARRLAGSSPSSSASEAGNISAAPTPCATRPARSRVQDGAAMTAVAPSPYRASPSARTLRLPSRSAKRPAVASSAATAAKLTVLTQVTSDSGMAAASGSRLSTGIANVVAVLSAMIATTTPEATSRSTANRPRIRRAEGIAGTTMGPVTPSRMGVRVIVPTPRS